MFEVAKANNPLNLGVRRFACTSVFVQIYNVLFDNTGVDYVEARHIYLRSTCNSHFHSITCQIFRLMALRGSIDVCIMTSIKIKRNSGDHFPSRFEYDANIRIVVAKQFIEILDQKDILR